MVSIKAKEKKAFQDFFFFTGFVLFIFFGLSSFELDGTKFATKFYRVLSVFFCYGAVFSFQRRPIGAAFSSMANRTHEIISFARDGNFNQ